MSKSPKTFSKINLINKIKQTRTIARNTAIDRAFGKKKFVCLI